ncbi:MAG: Asp-tRNA(Asn)/Glu-tRNA(Gln) amidotransferase subunit GatA [Flavobacteriia bacterium]|nr:Asp-tRNA(Asn)/Glu-tRNA(Gln) amidotransferase subunit GatA [Flavobacteriia bacterium]
MSTTAQAVEQFLSKIEATQDLNIFLEVWADEAREHAKAVDAKIAAGTAGKLAGMVIALKDNICYRGHKVSAASKILDGFESQFSATVVDRLLAEDAVFIGRTNCDEFAMGSGNENSAFGPVKNPLDPSKVPGGSSGGSAAAVAAGLCHVALGSDTGGSIRQPASFTGTIGFKPSYGRVSRHGLIAYASSFDQIGPFAANVEDAAKVMEVIAGPDDFDATAMQEAMAPAAKLAPKKVAYLKTAVDNPAVDEHVKKAFLAQLELLENAGVVVEPVEFDLLDTLVPIYYILTTAEASSNLARFDGVHAGYRHPDSTDLESVYKKSRSEGFGVEVQRRIMLGTFVLSSGYYDAYFGKAQAARRLVQEWTDKMLEEYDLILCPTAPTTAFEIGREVSDPTVNYLEDIFTVQANIAGIPAVSIPMGVHPNGLPMGLQLMGAEGADMDVLAMAQWIQKH